MFPDLNWWRKLEIWISIWNLLLLNVIVQLYHMCLSSRYGDSQIACTHVQLVPGVQLYPVFENQESGGLKCSMGEDEDRGQLLPCGMLAWILPGLLMLIPVFLLWLQATGSPQDLSLDSPSFCRLGVDVCYEHGHLSNSFTVLKPEGWGKASNSTHCTVIFLPPHLLSARASFTVQSNPSIKDPLF